MDRTKIDIYHKKIREDRLFSLSSRYSKVLDYLVEKALLGEDLKEITIGTDLFEGNYGDGEGDGSVRVHIYNVRKRLKKYYETSGIDDEVEFVLPKGEYNIQFCERKPQSKSGGNRGLYAILSTFVAAIIITTLVVCSVPRERYFWRDFLSGDMMTNCIIADQLVMLSHGVNETIAISHSRINSRSDYDQYIRERSADTLVLQDYTYFTKAIPQSIQRLTEWFGKDDCTFSIVPESEFNIQHSRSANIIYIGQFKNMNLSRAFFLKDSKMFGVENNNFYSIKDGEKRRYIPRLKIGASGYEYAMVSYVPISGGFKALFFSSNHDMGTINLVTNFTNVDFLKNFYQNLPSPDCYFNALFKIEGINRTDMNCELIDIEIMEL